VSTSGEAERFIQTWAARLACVIAASLLAAGCVVGSKPSRQRSGVPGFQKGVAFTGYARDSYEGSNARRSLEALRATNANWISLLVTGYQDTAGGTVIDFHDGETPTDASLAALIQFAHGAGLKVMLKPHVDILNDPGHYRGEIGPYFGEAEWAAWFASYREFILHYAGLAATAGADLFCVGCELGTTAGHAAEWRGIIAEIRRVYRGPLVYADNLVETDPEAVLWWDAVDFIGEDAYPTLSEADDPSPEELLAGCLRFREKLQALSAKWNKPLILTEIGFRSIRGGAMNPWDWQRQGAVDLEVQARCYEATFKAAWGQSWLAGIYWWQWAPDPADGGHADSGYSPHGKPAELVLTAWYAKSW
jgi:Glycoside Hydrolase Family 113